MNLLLSIILLPLLAAPVCLMARKWAKWIALAASALALLMSVMNFTTGEGYSSLLNLRSYGLSAALLMGISLFTLLIVAYSFKFMEGRERLPEYYTYILITLGAASGVVLAFDWITLLIFWGTLGITLYLLIGIGGPDAAGTAKKTLIMVGGSDAFMIVGIGILAALTKDMGIGILKLPLNNVWSILAFFSLFIGAAAKAGILPLHSWIPDSAESAPATVMAYLPASLDKLLGIYLLFRTCTDVFEISPNSPISIFLLAVGSLTIIIAVMAALVQHNLKKLLSFHAVSQVGYMVLGIGTGIPVGVAGALFHMFNHAIYKSLLFLSAGAVERECGTTELDKLGGLARYMPATFAVTAIAAASISGLPPLNGFVSKWMVYQGILELARTSPYFIIWLTAAMFGSALTLASFIKILHSVFLVEPVEPVSGHKEAGLMMLLPMGILAILCVLFGVFAYALPLKNLVLPAVSGVTYLGFFDPLSATLLILAGLMVGVIIYWLSNFKTAAPKPVFIGGEEFPEQKTRVSGVTFYNTIREQGRLPFFYKLADRRAFDIYSWGDNSASYLYGFLKWMHSGNLHSYLAWMLLGCVICLLVFARQ